MSPARVLGGVAVVAFVAESLAYENVLAALVVTAFGIGVAAVFVYVALPRLDASIHPFLAISFGVTALFTTIAFWGGLPFGFGAAAIVAAERPASVGAILGVLAIVIASVFCIIA